MSSNNSAEAAVFFHICQSCSKQLMDSPKLPFCRYPRQHMVVALSTSGWLHDSDVSNLLFALKSTVTSTYCVENLNALRAFAANCGRFDGVIPEFIEIIEKVANQDLPEAALNGERQEILDSLERYYQEAYDDDPSYAAVVEADLTPLERLCDCTINWDELCEVASRIASRALRRQYQPVTSAQLADLLRKWLPCPWTNLDMATALGLKNNNQQHVDI